MTKTSVGYSPTKPDFRLLAQLNPVAAGEMMNTERARLIAVYGAAKAMLIDPENTEPLRKAIEAYERSLGPTFPMYASKDMPRDTLALVKPGTRMEVKFGLGDDAGKQPLSPA